MEVTRYGQSCLVIEHGDARLAIDPGTITTERFQLAELGRLDAVLYTHRHADHCDPRWVAPLLDAGVTIYGNADVATALDRDGISVVADGERLEIAGLDVRATDLPHCRMVDGSPGPPNTGFVVADALLHPGDSVDPSELRVPTAAVPIVGTDISFRDAATFAEQVGVARIIPIHYDGMVAHPHQFARMYPHRDRVEVVVLDDGETAGW